MKTHLQLSDRPCISLTRYLIVSIAVIAMLCMMQGCNWFSSTGLYDLPEPDSTALLILNPPKFSGTLVFTHNNDIYINDGSGKWAERITQTPEKKKGLLALAYDKTKIAYLNEAGIPEILSLNGEFIEMASPSGVVKDMGWSPNSGTLYMLVGNSIEFHGPAMPVQQPVRSPVYSLHIARNLDMIYSHPSSNSSRTLLEFDFYDPARRDRFSSILGKYEYVRLSYDSEYFLAAFTAQQEAPWTGTGVIQNKVHTGWTQNVSGSRDSQLSFSSSPVFLGQDTIIFAYGPESFGREETLASFSNLHFSSRGGVTRIPFVSNFQEKSESVYIDWKP